MTNGVVAPYLAICREDSEQHEYSLGAVFNGRRYIVKTNNQWRFIPHDLPRWPLVYQQVQRCIRAGVFEVLVEDLRFVARRKIRNTLRGVLQLPSFYRNLHMLVPRRS